VGEVGSILCKLGIDKRLDLWRIEAISSPQKESL